MTRATTPSEEIIAVRRRWNATDLSVHALTSDDCTIYVGFDAEDLCDAVNLVWEQYESVRTLGLTFATERPSTSLATSRRSPMLGVRKKETLRQATMLLLVELKAIDRAVYNQIGRVLAYKLEFATKASVRRIHNGKPGGLSEKHNGAVKADDDVTQNLPKLNLLPRPLHKRPMNASHVKDVFSGLDRKFSDLSSLALYTLETDIVLSNHTEKFDQALKILASWSAIMSVILTDVFAFYFELTQPPSD